MGIKQLMTVINEKAGKAVRKVQLSDYSGKIVACDASMAMYQFLIATQNTSHPGFLTDESGNPTSHLIGIFYRTILFLDNGIKPIWVFDGTAPDLKIQELRRRKNFKFQAQEKIKAFQQKDDQGEVQDLDIEKHESSERPKINPGEIQRKKQKNGRGEGEGEKKEELKKEEGCEKIKGKKKENKEKIEKDAENKRLEDTDGVKKKKRSLSNRQWQVIQKKRYGDELEQIEESLRSRISAIVHAPVYEISGQDYMCCGESDAEEITVTKELEQIVASLENKGSRIFYIEHMEEVHKNLKRTTYITSEMVEDVKEMLIYLGVPVILAPCEAEAQCAELVKSGKAHAVASEDMDALAFGSLFLLRGFSNKKEPVIEINFNEVLSILDFTYEEFVDFCILLGCDYSKTIGGVGAAKAYALIKQCSKIETVIEFIESGKGKKFEIPEDFPFNEARNLFIKPKVLNGASLDIVWNQPNEELIKNFLVGAKGFSLNRVENSLKRLKKSHIGNQPKIDNFFVVPNKRASDGEADKKQKKLKF